MRTIRQPSIVQSLIISGFAVVAFALVTAGTMYWRTQRLVPCEPSNEPTVDAPVDVVAIDDLLVVSYFMEKGPQHTEAELSLTRSAQAEFRSAAWIDTTPRLLRVKDDPARIESRYLISSAQVRAGSLTVFLCVDAGRKLGLSGGTYRGVVTVGEPSSATIDVPVEVNYRSRTGALGLAAAPVFAFLSAWALVRKDSAASIFESWYMLFAAGTIGAILGWFTFLNASPFFRASSLAAMAAAVWAGSTGASAFIAGLTKGATTMRRHDVLDE